MHYVIESMQKWATVSTDAHYWHPLVEHIVRKHDLPQPQQIRAGHPGSNAVFWVNETFIVKIFGPWWAGDADRELATYHHLAPFENLLIPKVLAWGSVEAGQRWKYIIMEGLAGEPIGDVWGDVQRENQLQIAEHLGEIVQALHCVPVVGIQAMETDPAYWRKFVQSRMENCVVHHREHGSLPEHLLRQIPDYLERAMPLFPDDFSPCIVNADLTEDHVLLRQTDAGWQVTGIIDFGDVEIGHRDYEWVALFLGAFDCDAEVMQAFLRAYEHPNGIDLRFNHRMMAYSILHRYLNFKEIVSLTNRCDFEEIGTLEALQEILWNVQS